MINRWTTSASPLFPSEALVVPTCIIVAGCIVIIWKQAFVYLTVLVQGFQVLVLSFVAQIDGLPHQIFVDLVFFAQKAAQRRLPLRVKLGFHFEPLASVRIAMRRRRVALALDRAVPLVVVAAAGPQQKAIDVVHVAPKLLRSQDDDFFVRERFDGHGRVLGVV